MKHVRILGVLLAFVFALGALPEVAAARTTRHSVSSHHTQARRGHRHKKRARRHRRKHASNSSGSKSSNGLEF